MGVRERDLMIKVQAQPWNNQGIAQRYITKVKFQCSVVSLEPQDVSIDLLSFPILFYIDGWLPKVSKTPHYFIRIVCQCLLPLRHVISLYHMP